MGQRDCDRSAIYDDGAAWNGNLPGIRPPNRPALSQSGPLDRPAADRDRQAVADESRTVSECAALLWCGLGVAHASRVEHLRVPMAAPLPPVTVLGNG